MALCQHNVLFLLLFLSSLFSFSTQEKAQHRNDSFSGSLSFPLKTTRLGSIPNASATFRDSLLSNARRNPRLKTASYNYKLSFQYTMALIVSLPIGTPPQTKEMVLDTGSQLSWIQCHKKAPKLPPPTAPFDPSLSSTFSVLPCTHPICKPRVPDFTLPTTCDQNRLCHYSYFYADGTFAEGNLVREKFTFSRSVSTPPFILGCAKDPSDTKGILGMNLGRLSFASQAKLAKFSYCVPTRQTKPGSFPTGSFYLGNNPNSQWFKYVDLLTFHESQRSPNLDPLAFTLPMQGIRIGAKKLSIPPTVFRPDSSGSGQTMIDSGSDFTFLVDEAYNTVRDEVVRLIGPKIKRGYVYAGVADMCFQNANTAEIGRLVGDMVFELDKGVEIVAPKERILADVGGGVHCLAIGRSNMLGAASNIIGNFHQQNYWVEFDLVRRRVGFGKADCTRSV
ncbi:Aspartic peptidase [Parasponia andersonii]|uniref:Aspartic peptidase n=1 Tax=Parasponia andersonii TaxID=3476 RepID=A0A2P5AAD4_PARAD|nr:Aspartic peptidase [Parasponia andersonii]